MREDDLRELFTAVTPPSTLEHRWRESAVLCYVVRAPVRLRTLVIAFAAFAAAVGVIGVVVLTGGVASRLPAPAVLRWQDDDPVVTTPGEVVMRDDRFGS